MTAAALLVVLGSALLMELGGLSTAMGAFAAGVLLSTSSFRHQLEADIEPFRGLLLGLFFLGVGMSLDLAVVASSWVVIATGVAVLVIVKSLGIYTVGRITKSSHYDAMDRAVLMAQGGEFAFVLYAAASAQGVINAEINANLTAIVVLSMVFTPFSIIMHNKYIVPLFNKRHAQRADDHIDEQQEIILIGIGRYGQIINHLLTMTGYKVTVIDLDEKLIKALKKRGIKTYYGNATRPELLRNAGVESANLLIVAVNDKKQALQIVEHARELNPTIKIIARAYDRYHVFDLFRAGADIQVRETFDSALRTAKEALQSLGMEKEVADEIGEYYFHKDRHSVRRMAEVYDPKIDRFNNEELIKIALENDQQIMLEIQEIMQRER